MRFAIVPLLFLHLVPTFSSSESSLIENASYKNLNPRPYDNCEANDLIKLSACCNDVLADLDDCKAGDLACECCALQSMDSACYSLCPGNPSTNFLAVLFDDCAALNDVNACNIPFKRVDGDRPASFRNRKAGAEALKRASSSVKTQLGKNGGEGGNEDLNENERLIQNLKDENRKDNDEGSEDVPVEDNPDFGFDVQTKIKPRVHLIGNATATGMF